MLNEDTEFLFISPVNPSTDVSRDVTWYENNLGFRNVYDSSAYKTGTIDYAVVGRQDKYIHLQFQYPEDVLNVDTRIEVNNIEPLIQTLIQKGLISKEKIKRNTEWKTTEMMVQDPSGNRITFFEET